MALVIKLLVISIILQSELTASAPLSTVQTSSPQRLFKRTNYEIGCYPELPEAPYPPNLNMREIGSRGPGGGVGIIGYTDQWGEREYLYTFTDICDRAGCHCVGNRIACFNWGILFVPGFYFWYKNACLASCECFLEDSDIYSVTEVEGSNSSSSTYSSVSSGSSVNNYDSDWAAENAQKMRQVYSNVNASANIENGRAIERSAPPASNTPANRLTGRKPCLAGQAAGWTFRNFARGHCCPGYRFTELSASEAFVNYGLPIDYIVAGLWNVGMCLKTLSG